MAQKVFTMIKAPDPGRAGQPRAAGRACARSAQRQHHGVLQGVQRPHAGPERAHHSCRDHGLRRSFVQLHHEDAAGRRADQGSPRHREGLRRAESQQGRTDLEGSASPDSGGQDARPQCPGRRPGDAGRGRHSQVDGRRGRGNDHGQGRVRGVCARKRARGPRPTPSARQLQQRAPQRRALLPARSKRARRKRARSRRRSPRRNLPSKIRGWQW